MAALTSTSHCNNLNSFLKQYNYSKQHLKSIQNAVIIPSSLSTMETLIKTSNGQTWKNKDYGRIRPRRSLEVVKCSADERQMSDAGVASPDSTLEEIKDESGYQYKLICLMALGMYLCSAHRMYLLDNFTSDTPSMSPEAAYSIQVTFQGLYIVFSVMFGALVDVFGGARIMGVVIGLWFLPSILFLLVVLLIVCFFRPMFSLEWFSLIYLIPLAALQYLWHGIMTLLKPRQIHHTTITILVLPTVFGLAQSLTFPSMNVLLSRWFPITERGRAVGIVLAGMQLGNVLVFRQTNTTFGHFVCVPLGFVWLISWVCELKFYSKQRKNADSCHTNSQTPLSFPNLILKKPFWAILFANFTYNWGYFVLLLWMPFYFKNVLNVNLNEEPWFEVIPWGVMAVSSYIAGWISDYLKKAGCSLLFVHKLMQTIGFVGPGLALLCLTYAKTPKFASLLLTIAISFTPFSQVGLFLNIQDIAPYLVGLIHGITNIVGTYGATICLFKVCNIVKLLGSYEAFLILTSMLYFTTTIFYNLCATTERII